ncbi:leucine-rich repeat-containing protein 41 isoform X1 [Oryzias melastigma]|uniref:Leucine-rich repeat-containing protein 41 n=2 Tax=Oryzias melastigma TaxID=30732 RepID=A0A3B3BP37_ORYME|nr:leucine-rich repeat-containing protein 41 isoform X1 [Oryzias melastigma]
MSRWNQKPENPRTWSLKERCLRATALSFPALRNAAVLDLPTDLLQDLLLHLNVCQLNDIQASLNHRGISTYSAWFAILIEMNSFNHAVDFTSVETVRHEVMRLLFQRVFYSVDRGLPRAASNVDPSLLLQASAMSADYLILGNGCKDFERRISEWRPLLKILEERVKRVCISEPTWRSETITTWCVIHRLLDHGVATELVFHSPCPTILARLLQRRGSHQPEQDGELQSPCLQGGCSESQCGNAPPCKREKMETVSMEGSSCGGPTLPLVPRFLCRRFSQVDSPVKEACPRGRIHYLEVRHCKPESFKILTSVLPTFSSLRSLTLYSITSFSKKDVLDLASALRRRCCASPITHLNVGALPEAKLIAVLLESSPSLKSLHVDIQAVVQSLPSSPAPLRTPEPQLPAELPLEELTVQVSELSSDLSVLMSVLRRSPHLTSLSVAGIRLPPPLRLDQLLSTLTECNRRLRKLHLKDLKLFDCLPEVLKLLRSCSLEELDLIDCRLLERSKDKDYSLQMLVDTLKTLPSLHTLRLTRNRLAGSVHALAELFSGPRPSSLKRLDISFNFIQAADLMEFADRLEAFHSPPGLILDLRRNPVHFDRDTWEAATLKLRPLTLLQEEGWSPRLMMADHVSNM